MNSWLRLLQSVFGGLLGVQSRAQWDYDAAQKNPWRHLLAGFVLAVLVVGSLVLLVIWVLPEQG